MKILIAIALIAAIAMPVSAGSLIAPAGYALTEISFNEFVGGFDIAPNGDFIVLEGQTLKEVTPGGDYASSLYTYSDFVWGSFVRVDAARGKVYFGESYTNWIKSVGLDGSNETDIAKVPSAYDFAVNNAGQMFVVTGPDIYMLSSSNPDLIVNTTGSSGPLAFDDEGNLYYGTASSIFGETGGQKIVKWTASQVAGAIGPSALSIADGTTLLYNIDGPSGLVCDGSDLYFTSSVQYPGKVMLYSNGAANVFADAAAAPEGYTSWITTIHVNPANGAISVLGGTMKLSDYSTVYTISTLTPVPEPSSLMILILGIGGLLLRRRR